MSTEVQKGKLSNGDSNGHSRIRSASMHKPRIILEPEPDPAVPNGGYGWVVVLASFMCNLTVDGICYTFGIFLPYFIEEFHSNEAVTALAGSLLSGCYMTAGVFVSGLVNRFGCRPVAIVGSLLAACSFGVSVLAPNVYVLIVTYGIITGISFGHIYLPSIVSVGFYFTTKRAFATGIAVCGSGMGASLFSPFTQFLLHKLHWKGTLLVLSGCIALCTLYSFLMRPLRTNEPKVNGRERKISTVSRISYISTRPRRWTITSQMTDFEAVQKNSVTEIFNLAVLKEPAMLLLSLSNIFGMTGYYIPYVFVVRYATQTLDVAETDAAFLLSSIGFSNVLGRLVFGLVSDRFSGYKICGISITALLINNACMLSAGAATMLVPYCHNYWTLMTVCVFFGFTISSYMSLTSIILVDLLGLERLSTTFGLISCFRGISSIVGPPLAGLLYELTLSYTLCFLVAGGLIIVASLISFIVHRYEENEEDEQ